MSPVQATDQQRWRRQLEGVELQTTQFPIGRSAERASVLIGRRQPVRPAGAPAQQILITTNIQVNFLAIIQPVLQGGSEDDFVSKLFNTPSKR